MPEVRFEVEWPDGTARSYYSPSLVVEDYFAVGARYPVPEFVRLSREALAVASDRVRARYGFPCARSVATLDAIEGTAHGFDGPAGDVVIRAFHR
jgi:uncharacterized repeat protein (TIGR04042 family)